MDWRVLLFTIFLALITGVMFGLIPGLSACRTSPDAALRESPNRAGTGLAHAKARSSLVVIEVSLAFVLLIASALFIRTLIALRSVDPGFDAHNVATTETPLDPKLLKTSKIDRVVQNAIQRLDDLPGVESVGLTTLLPLGGGFIRVPVSSNAQVPTMASEGFARYVFVSPDYFGALRIPLLRRRFFTDDDRLDSPPVAIVNQAMARQLWRSGDALGERIIIGKGLGPRLEQSPRQIVGIVGDVRENGLNEPPQPAAYIPFAQRRTAATVSWVVRTRKQSASLNTEIQNALRQATGLPVPPPQSMEDVIAQSTERQSFNMSVMLIFGASALVLAMIGLYGVMSYLVVQRTHEIGVRMALGAQRRDLVKMVVGEGFKLTMVGVMIGVGGAAAVTRFLSSLLFGVKPTDPLTFIAVSFVFIGVALAACYIPACRAARVDPMVALRHE